MNKQNFTRMVVVILAPVNFGVWSGRIAKWLFSSAGPEHCFGNRVTDASSSASHHLRFCPLHSETPLGVQPAQQF